MTTTKTPKTAPATTAERTPAKSSKVTPETVVAALAGRPDVTAAELAATLGIGQSTTAKHLAALEATGRAGRAVGGRDGGRRVADRWSLPPLTTPAETPGAAPADQAATADKAPADDAPADEAAMAAGAEGRLGRGQLGSLVYDYLAGAGEDLGPVAVAKALHRSSGAVANSLAAMAERGVVDQVGDKPRRYRLATR